jgi:cytochrome P450
MQGLAERRDRLAERPVPVPRAPIRRAAGGDRGVAARRRAAQRVTRIGSRASREDVALGAVTIPAGGRVLVYVAAANRDPARWSEAERFAVERERRPRRAHLHRAPLARLEAQAAQAALRRHSRPRGRPRPARVRGRVPGRLC